MRLVVHIGAPKAASTYLQLSLGLNEDVLREHRIYLPTAGRRDARGNHPNLPWQLRGDSRYRAANGTWDALAEEVAGVDADVVVLSSEGFAQVASDERLRGELARLLRTVADDVTLVYVVREPLARINSMYAQVVKSFANPTAFDEYAERLVETPLYNLEESFRYWYENDRVGFTAVRFDEFVKVGPLQSLLQIIGVDIDVERLTIPTEVSNPTPGPIAVEAIRLLNAHLRVMDAGFSRRSSATAKLSQVAQRRAAKLGWSAEKFWGWDVKQATWAAQQLAPSNERFAQAVWGTAWPLELPTTKKKTAVALIDRPVKVRKSVDDYVAAMTRRYLALLDGTDRSVSGDSDGDVDEDVDDGGAEEPVDEDGDEDGDDS